MPIRLKDIAQELGVSVVTVSKVLRNHDDIGEATRQRVLQRLKELNYRPNLAARALVTGRSYAVGFIVPDLVHPFFGTVARGITRVLRQKGYNLVIATSEEDPSLEQEEIAQLLSRRVDALIIASTQADPAGFAEIDEHRVPYVLVDRRFPEADAHFVGIDDLRAGYLATRHLIEQGCRRVAHIRGVEISPAIGRLDGYRQAVAESGFPEIVVANTVGDQESDQRGRDAMRKLLALDPKPDGVFCFNDPTAAGAIQAILEADLRVPEDVAVIGCGNVRFADMLRVPLSTVDQDSGGLGERAAQLALRAIELGDADQPETVLLEPRLVPRASSLRR